MKLQKSQGSHGSRLGTQARMAKEQSLKALLHG
jgi:hypothetical protein